METRGSRRKRMQLEQLALIVPEDRISNLPVEIIHDIISLLPARAAGRLPLMSKKWQYFYKTLQSINFDFEEFEDKSGTTLSSKIDEFVTKRLSIRNPHVLQRVKVATHPLLHSRFLNHIGKCLNLAIQGRIQELDLSLWHTHEVGSICYILPSKFFKSQLELTVLKLKCCRVSDYQILRFPNLKVLSLKDVHINNDSLFIMVHGCPRLESLILESCDELENVNIVNHSLRIMVVKYCLRVRSFSMDVPLLHTFEYDASNENFVDWEWVLPVHFETPEHVIFGNLRVLYLSYVMLNNANLQHLFDVFPSVDDMKIKRCLVIDQTKVVHANVKKFTVVDVHFPKLVEGFTSSVESLYCHISRLCFQFNNFIPSGSVEFVRLTSLTIGGFFILSDEALEYLISHSPVLENLNLRNCFRLRNPKIASSVLKTLTIEANDGRKDYEIKVVEILTPYLLSFVYDGPPIKFSRILVSEKLVCKLRLRNFRKNGLDPQPLKLWDTVEQFNVASRLTLATSSTEMLVITEGPGQVPSWFKWGHSKLILNRSYMCYLDVLSFLNHLRCCKTFSIELSSSSIQLKFENPTQLEIANLHLDPMHDCIRYHLVEAQFDNFDANIHAMRLVEYLLLNAEHLKTLVIHMKSRILARDPYPNVPVMDIIEKIPYVSRKCQIRAMTPL